MSLWRATLTLLAGGALAQALPLLLGPWLTRLYSPDDWGRYALFSAVAANLGVIACGRYEYALPLAADDAQARDLMALCLHLLLAVTLLSVLLAALLHATQSLEHAVLFQNAFAGPHPFGTDGQVEAGLQFLLRHFDRVARLSPQVFVDLRDRLGGRGGAFNEELLDVPVGIAQQ